MRAHPGVCYASFAASLATNVAVIVEGLYRYRFLHDANQRRRIRMAVYTGVPSVLAYFVKDGVPVVAGLLGARELHYPLPVTAVLQALVLLPAFGLPYAVGVARVLGPRLVLRRSIQYALATRTLSVLGIAPLVALVVSLARNSNKTLAADRHQRLRRLHRAGNRDAAGVPLQGQGAAMARRALLP